MRTSEQLRAAWAYIDKPMKWCQGRDYMPVLGGGGGYQYCSRGAILKAGLGLGGLIEHYLNRATCALDPQYSQCQPMAFIGYNDRLATTHADIARMWALAIEMAEYDEAATAEFVVASIVSTVPPVVETIDEADVSADETTDDRVLVPA